tara:strand:- start:152 stop:388 length:237 start_codon:yes stop_codon:yes gene_type:complete
MSKIIKTLVEAYLLGEKGESEEAMATLEGMGKENRRLKRRIGKLKNRLRYICNWAEMYDSDYFDLARLLDELKELIDE